VAAFGFGLAVLEIYREHDKTLFSLIALVRRNTARSDQIVVVAGRDAGLAAETGRLTEAFDRWIVVTDKLPERASAPTPAFLLSAQPIEGGAPPTASSAIKSQAMPMVDGALQWFMKHVSRRKPGDRLEMAETYYLYPISPVASASVQAPEAAPAGITGSPGQKP